jgi:hypothetical protein
MTSTAVVFFIGLIVFSRDFTERPSRDFTAEKQLQALIPLIPYPTTATRHTRLGHGVEGHAAFIAFPACDYVSSDGWSPSGLEAVKGYLFVRLNGERVRFEDGSPSAPKAEPLSNAHTARVDEVDELRLPHLTKCCTNEMTLKQDYKGPDFRGAAAVFDLPSGHIQGCTSRKTRVDTRMTFDNGGNLLISATKGRQRKSITLLGGAQVIVANFPEAFLRKVAESPHSSPHYEAYYAMTTAPSCAAQYRDCVVKETSAEDCFDPSIIREAIVAGAPVPLPMQAPPEFWTYARMDYECSNTQWP